MASVASPGSDLRERTSAVTQVALGDLRPHPRNPRKIRPERLEQLKRALAADPEMLLARPLIALPDGTVVAGNQRLRAALALGWETIPVVYADLDEARATEWMLRDNRPYGDDDEELTGMLLAELAAAGADLDLTGYASAEIDALLLASRPAPVVDPDEVPPLPEVPRSKLGEVYELGPHRLMCGDAMDPGDREELFAGALAAVVVTSPPYNQHLDAFKPSGMQAESPAWVERMAGAYSDSLPEDVYQASQVEMLDALLDVTTENASVFYNHKPRYRDKAVVLPTEWITRSRWRIRQEIVWDRGSSITLNARMFMPVDERIYWLTCGDDFTFHDTADVKAWGSVWSIAPIVEIRVSAPFPNEIPWRCIGAASVHGDIVFDPYGGSGTTLIAAERLGRIAYLMEIDPAYCDVIRDRYASFVGEAPDA